MDEETLTKAVENFVRVTCARIKAFDVPVEDLYYNVCAWCREDTPVTGDGADKKWECEYHGFLTNEEVFNRMRYPFTVLK